MRVPMAGDMEDVKVSPRGGNGVSIYQDGHRISIPDESVLGLVDAIVNTVTANRAKAGKQ